MSSWVSLPRMDLSNSEYLLSQLGQSYMNMPIQGDLSLEQTEVSLDNIISRSRNVTNNFEVYQPPMVFNHAIPNIQSQGNILEDFLQMQPQSTTIHGADGRGSAMLNKKNKRMIKNRESAARSRARRQAYTSQLEIEVKLLKEENRMLKENLKKIQSDITILEAKKRSRPSSSAEF